MSCRRELKMRRGLDVELAGWEDLWVSDGARP